MGAFLHFFRLVMDFAFGVFLAIRTAERNIAAATPGSLFIPAPCVVVVITVCRRLQSYVKAWVGKNISEVT